MPLQFFCRSCKKKVAELRYLSKSRHFLVITKNCREEFVHLSDAIDFLSSRLEKCPFCGKKRMEDEGKLKRLSSYAFKLSL